MDTFVSSVITAFDPSDHIYPVSEYIYSYAVGLCCNACHERCNSVSDNSSVVTDILMDRLSLLFEHVIDGVTTMFKICIIRYLLHFSVRFF